MRIMMTEIKDCVAKPNKYPFSRYSGQVSIDGVEAKATVDDWVAAIGLDMVLTHLRNADDLWCRGQVANKLRKPTSDSAIEAKYKDEYLATLDGAGFAEYQGMSSSERTQAIVAFYHESMVDEIPEVFPIRRAKEVG